MLELKVHSLNTELPSVELLEQRYSQYLSQEQFDEFDNGKVNLGITLFERGALDQSSESFNAEFFLEIDQSIYADKWVRVLLPLSSFKTYTQKNYQEHEANLHAFDKAQVYGFRINPESSHGKQLRDLIGGHWSDSIPETFKQMSISLRRLSLLAK